MLPSQYFRLILHGVMKTLSRGRYVSVRSISTTSVLLQNYYQVLGIPRSATQGDIKAAYYKLSMLYHPDKNKDNEKAVEKFRAITEAYEVLGNFKLRKMYDKGIIHTAGSQYSHMRPRYPDEQPEEPDDAQTKFYKAHMKKSQVPNASGRTPIYDFDEWSRAHYGSSFARRKAAKEKFEEKTVKQKREVAAIEMEFLLYGLSFLIAGFLIVNFNQYSLDAVIEKKVENDQESNSNITSRKQERQLSTTQ